MDAKRSRRAPALSFIVESLDSRVVLSGVGTAVGAASQGVAEVAAQSLKKAATHTTMAITAGTLGQPITFNITVRGPAAAGSPAGTINITDQGHVVQTLTLAPTTSTNARYATGGVTVSLAQPPGGAAFYLGKHTLGATFVPSAGFQKSAAVANFTVSPPNYTALAGGVQVATVATGSGPTIQAGQTAHVLYTGYLARNGKIFDDSASHGGTPLDFQVGAGQVVPGFDAGTLGMKAGETRAILIPAAQGYGATANGPIPANSNLVFLVTLRSIS